MGVGGGGGKMGVSVGSIRVKGMARDRARAETSFLKVIVFKRAHLSMGLWYHDNFPQKT